ncbi:hypothetical protein Leryth_006417 [Lithospermum erythrorhizon]|nr:hypothetical protein Leryth_006417 [Lithospermum erythrorhizon]
MKRNRVASSSSLYAEKGNMWIEDSRPDADMDELLAVLGYKVKSSDMVDVARNLEKLDILMCNNNTPEDDISHLSNDTVHYNPSDLSGWVNSMLVELKPTNNTSTNLEFGSRNGFICFSNDQENQLGGNNFDDDLRAIPGDAVLRSGNVHDFEDGVEKNSKKIKSFSFGSDFTTIQESVVAQPVVVVDTQEAGIRLVHTMMACAEAVEQNDMKLGGALVKHIEKLAAASAQVGAMQKVATYFAEALARRIYKINPCDLLQSSYNDVLEMHFYETCPYLKFAHFTANQAILEAFSGAKRVHVIDFSLKQGMQWPALLQALALRPGGPPAFRLTGVGPPQPDNTDSLQEVGWKLAQLAESIGVEFEFKGFVANSSNIQMKINFGN